jgi:ATP-dependent Clp protease protease subunit
MDFRLDGEKADLLKSWVEAALESGIDIIGRRIFLHGAVEDSTISVAIRGMYMIADIDQSKPIELYVSSYGGELDEAFALHDVTRTIKAPVHTVALGKCMSAAPMLVACGQKGERYAAENTTFMLHDAIMEHEEGDSDSPANVIAGAKLAMETMDRYASLLAKYTLKEKRFWKRIFDSKVDRFFTADQALEWGLVDGIWSEKD